MSTATAPLLDVEAYLQPIPGDNPAGTNLAYEPEYDEIREARRADEDIPQGDWQRKAKTADWEQVLELGTDILKRKSKDLQVAGWVAEALAKRHGFAGLRDGLLLMVGIQERFWETYYPELDLDDFESRYGPFILLDTVFPPMIRSIKLTAGYGEEQYSFYRWQESRATNNAGMKSQELMDAMIAEGKITGKQFDDQVAQTPRSFYETLVADLREAFDAAKALDASVDARFGRHAPGLVNLRKSLQECLVLLEPILKTKRELEPEPGDEPEPADAQAEGGEDDASEGGYGDEEQVAAPRRRAPARRRSAGGPITSAEDAIDRIVEATAFLRENEPSSPVPYVVVRALRMAEAYGLPQPLDPTLLDPPSSEARMALRRLQSEGEWGQLLEQSELALGRPEGRGWLDAHRYALAAMASGDADRSAAATACRSLLRAFLADFPELPDAELGDGTPTANGETRAWLRDEILPPPPPEPSPSEPERERVYYAPPEPEPAASSDPEAQRDVWDEAMDLVRAGRTSGAIDLIKRAMASAGSGRERFNRKLQLAELCLMANRHHVALPLSEDLARLVDDYRLEEWESEQLCARVWAAYYRCLRGCGAGNGTAERIQQVFARLCRLDVNQALSFGGELPRD